MKTLYVVLLVGACLCLTASTVVNWGIGLPSNGPCSPLSNTAGICSDNGAPSFYDASGNLTHFSNMQGIQGIPGPPGPPPPANFTLTCKGAKGTIQSGFTTQCSWQ